MATEAQELSEAVAHWLSYKSLTGLRGLLTEASMGVPIAEYLASKYDRVVESEKNHPVLTYNSVGRPKQIDFVRQKRGDKTWHAAYECKFGDASMPAIFADICRLACLAQDSKVGSPERYFVYAGDTGADRKYVLDRSFNSGTQPRQKCFDSILPRGKESIGKALSFKILDLHPRQRKMFADFSSANAVKLPSKLRAKLSGWAEYPPFTCAVWRVNSARGSVLLDAAELSE